VRIERSNPTSEAGVSRKLVVGISAAVLLVVAVSAFVWLRPKPTEVTTVVAAAESSGPSLGTAVLNASGYVVARRISTVSSKVTGKIAEIFVEEGMVVKEGQVLARLEPENSATMLTMARRELEASKRNLAEIEVRLAEAQRNLARNESLVQQQLISQTARHASKAEVNALAARLAASQAQVKVAESGLQMRQIDFDDLEVRSPFAGVVISKNAQPGETISPRSSGARSRSARRVKVRWKCARASTMAMNSSHPSLRVWKTAARSGSRRAN
jgi:RND family efflux transporter MFP subunit